MFELCLRIELQIGTLTKKVTELKQLLFHKAYTLLKNKIYRVSILEALRLGCRKR